MRLNHGATEAQSHGASRCTALNGLAPSTLQLSTLNLRPSTLWPSTFNVPIIGGLWAAPVQQGQVGRGVLTAPLPSQVGTDSTPSLEKEWGPPERGMRSAERGTMKTNSEETRNLLNAERGTTTPEATTQHSETRSAECGTRNINSRGNHATLRNPSQSPGCRASVWSACGLTAAFSARQPSTDHPHRHRGRGKSGAEEAHALHTLARPLRPASSAPFCGCQPPAFPSLPRKGMGTRLERVPTCGSPGNSERDAEHSSGQWSVLSLPAAEHGGLNTEYCLLFPVSCPLPPAH